MKLSTLMAVKRAAGVALLGATCLVAAPSFAQIQIEPVAGTPEDIDLGKAPASTPRAPAAAPAPRPAPVRAGATSAGGATPAAPSASTAKDWVAPRQAARAPAGAPERLIFDKRPLLITLPVGKERLVSFAGPVALHVPTGREAQLSTPILGRTVYAHALLAFGPIRVIAEQLDGERLMIPIDLVADKSAAGDMPDVEVMTAHASQLRTGGNGGTGGTGATAQDPDAGRGAQDAEHRSVDPVVLTRYAARMLYAPVRLTGGDPAIRQVPVNSTPLTALMFGARVTATPVGAWRSGPLWVTAVLITNLSRQALEVDLQDIRGQWLTAASQHGRLGPAGSDTDTTALYLVCDKPFEACQR